MKFLLSLFNCNFFAPPHKDNRFVGITVGVLCIEIVLTPDLEPKPQTDTLASLSLHIYTDLAYTDWAVIAPLL